VISTSHSRTIRCTSFSPDGYRLAAASFDGTTSIWQLSTAVPDWKCVATLEGHENEVKAVAWSSSGSLIATCGRDKTVWIWQMDEDNEIECLAVLHEHTQDVKNVKWHPHDEVLVSCGYDNTLKVWRDWEDEWICSSTLSGHESTVWCFDFNSNGSLIASCSEDQSIRIWKIVNLSSFNYECIQVLSNAHNRSIYRISWSNQNDCLCSGGGDNRIHIYKESQGLWSLAHFITAHEGDVNCVSWHPKEPTILSCSDDGTVKVWDCSHDS
jgi:WD40 repeat protein